MAASGVRSSWLIRDRNSFLASPALRSSAFAACSSRERRTISAPIPLPALPQPDELGHVLDPVDDVADTAQVVHDGRVHRAPVAHLEPPALGLRPADVVLLHRHRVRPARLAHPLERRAQVADAGRGRIVGVVGEDVEDAAPEDVVAADHGRGQVRLAHRDDAKVGIEHQEQTRRTLEQRPKVNLFAAHLPQSP
jgi:hypothetical protein